MVPTLEENWVYFLLYVYLVFLPHVTKSTAKEWCDVWPKNGKIYWKKYLLWSYLKWLGEGGERGEGMGNLEGIASTRQHCSICC